MTTQSRLQSSTVPEDLEKIDFFSEEVLSDPYDVLARLRKERPVIKYHQATFGRDQYVVTTYELVEKVFRDHETFSSKFNEILTGGGKGNPEAERILAQGWPEVETLLTSDEPDHTRLRSLVAKAFMPGRIKRMSDLIAQTIDDLIDRFIEKGECDFVKDYAVPLPINSIGAILGIDPAYYDKLYDWTFSLMRRNGQMGTPEQQVEDAHQILELKQFVAKLIEERKARQTDDLISDLVYARVDGEAPLSDLETLSAVMLLIVGGAETTRSTLISAMARLLQNPDQVEMLRNDLSLTPKAIDEVLRMDTPGTALWRIAKRETEFGGVTIPQGAVIMIRMDSANRDEAVFDDPDKFDMFRPNINRHLSFGVGIHYCIGFRLAKEQLNQSIPALLGRLENLRMVEEKSDLRAHPSLHTRCLRALYLRFDPGPKKG